MDSSIATQLANRKLTNARACEFCGMMHDYQSRVCGNPACASCYQFCLRTDGCTWKNEAPSVSATVPKISAEQRYMTPQNLKEAFYSWLSSSELIQSRPDVEQAFSEFELFFKESLDPVDTDRTYLKVVIGEDGKGSIELLDAMKLKKNQDGCYVIVDGNKRIRVGKNVAIM